MNQKIKYFTLQLSRIKGFGPRKYQKLIEQYGGIERIYDLSQSGKLTFDIKPDDDIFNLLSKYQIDYKCYWEEDYPKNLRNISDPPIVLYYKGMWNIKKIDNSIAIVGTRKITSYGSKWTRTIASQLSEKGYSIVSGMAMGVDREAHMASLDSEGYTIAVLGGSVHKASPNINHDLYKRILDSGGIIISEFAPDIVMSPGLFPSRNRIIAGLSLGTLVVEAAEKSGALITADLALGYNREVFALPGNIDSKNSVGCNNIIKEGRAKLVQSVDDILVEFGHTGKDNMGVILNNEIVKNLTEVESTIYHAILAEPKFVEELALQLNLTLAEVSSIVGMLEVKGLVRKDEVGRIRII